MLYIERVLYALTRADHYDWAARSKRKAKLVPNIGVIGSDVRKTNCRIADALFDRVNRNFNASIAIYSIRLKTGSLNCRFVYIFVPLIVLAIVKRLDYKTYWHLMESQV